ncbi:hypothetical protein ITP53_50970 [Nonomuraea sp. K274]|uniref:DUF3558 domain-containing protein n=1 Tax=Nonomuraea cypriaca TaxID=1187855 RepID=A0A931F5N2_9ACTN|nr:hypothetical protein [Nonomuraea cypriaca]MBF8193867.1 hypothetical protein [Nonomuraea cypriaca]
MRRTAAAVILVLALTACESGGAPDSHQGSVATPPSPAAPDEFLACGSTEMRIPGMPPGLRRAGSFHRLDSLTRELEVKGLTWRESGERVYVGVVCGVRTAEGFATLVARSRLSVYRGRPALRWTTRTGLRNFMWLERPGTAVYVATTPGLASLIKQIAAGITRTPAP